MPNRHILVVDNDFLISHALKVQLEQQGYGVTVADGCRAAKEELGKPLKVDLMILDYLMADGNGTDLLCSLAEEMTLQRPRVIISSSLIDPDNPSWQLLRRRMPAVSQSLIHGYVPKPYTPDGMGAAVTEVLAGDY